MPEFQRPTFKFRAKGVNLAHPIDSMPAGTYPRLLNVRVNQQGGLCARPGQIGAHPNPGPSSNLHSVRRLNHDGAYQRFIGAGNTLYRQNASSNPTLVQSGLSGNPLTFIPFRPDQSPAPWMYVSDADSSLFKVDVNGTMHPVGYAPPSNPPTIELESNLYQLFDYFNNTGAWPFAGLGGLLSTQTRVSNSMAYCLFDTGTTGWATVSPAFTTDLGWMLPGVVITCNSYLGSSEDVSIQESHPAINTTTIAAILYDSGAAGPCSIVLTDPANDLARNSLVMIGSEVVRVLDVHLGENNTFSFRCVTSGTYTAGTVVIGIPSFRAKFNIAHNPSLGVTTLDASFIQFTVTGAGTGSITKSVVANLSKYANGRPLQPSDHMHVSIKFPIDPPTGVTSLKLMIDVDATSPDFTRNYYEREFTADDLTNVGEYAWQELIFPISSLLRIGTDPTRDLSTITALRVELTTTSTTTIGIASWSIIGGYGPNVEQGNPTGIYYRARYRCSTTGAKSVPGPTSYAALYPRSQSIAVTVLGTAQAGVDQIDIERFDPALQSAGTTTWVYVGSITNLGAGVPNTFIDEQFASYIALNQPLDTTVHQPFPRELEPIVATVNVSGTSIQYVSGNTFPSNLIQGTILLINGIPYSYSGRQTTTFLELTSNAGALTNASLRIASPVTYGNPMQSFGPLETTNGVYLFALDRGSLRWTNGNDFDGASTQNIIELTAAAEPLIAGIVWNNYVFVGTRTRLFMLQPAFSGGATFTPIEIPTGSGPLHAWSMCGTPTGVHFIGRDGVYRATPYNPATRISDEIYPLFPHEGSTVGIYTNAYYPIDYSTPTQIRLSCADHDLYLDYRDTLGNLCTMRRTKVDREADADVYGWFPYSYTYQVSLHYLEEVEDQTIPKLLQCTNTGILTYSGSTADVGGSISLYVRTPFHTFDDSRANKLIGDQTLSANANGDGTGFFVKLYANLTLSSPILNTTVGAGGTTRTQYIMDIAAGLGTLARSIALELVWNGGTEDCAVYEWQSAYVPKPPDVQLNATDWTDDGRTGAKFVRGIVLEADTRDATGTAQSRTVHVYRDGSIIAAALTVSHDGQLEKPYGFTPFVAHQLKLVPTDASSWRLHTVRYLWDEYPELSTLIPEDYSDLGEAGTKYIRGLVLEADTIGQSVNIQVQVDGGASIPFTLSALHNGRVEIPYSFDPPFLCHAVRLYPTGNVRIHSRRWIYDQYPELSRIYSPWTDSGHFGAKYIRGVRVKADTENQFVQFQVQRDGGNVAALATIQTNGQQIYPLAFDTPFLAYMTRLVPVTNWRLFDYQFIFDEYPDLTALITSWMDDGNIGAKFLQGVILDADTADQQVAFDVQGDDGVVIASVAGAQHNGRSQHAYTWTPAITHMMRIVPMGNMRIFGMKWVWEPSPELAYLWITQTTSNGIRGFGHARDAVIHHQSSADLQLTIGADNNNEIYTIPHGSGQPVRSYLPLRPQKGRMWSYSITSPSQFRLFKKSSFIRIKPWGAKEFMEIAPFGGDSFRSGADI